jgi:hypothetical protein
MSTFDIMIVMGPFFVLAFGLMIGFTIQHINDVKGE